MALSDRTYSYRPPSGLFPSGVKWLLISNITLFVLYFFATRFEWGSLWYPLGLTPGEVLRGHVWQLVAYVFLHDPSGFSHILFNMRALWMVGADLERTWGRQAFLK